MTDKFFPEALYELGFTDQVSVIPPGAQLTPSSKISQNQTGKVPGRRLPNGLWAGYDWRRHEPTLDEVRQWCIAGANVGLRADRFPGVDIDCHDEELAGFIELVALQHLGPAPVRYGRAPKRLLVYRTDEPFGRMRLWVQKGNDHHLVEVLGQGQQYLIHGTHPTTLKPYSWEEFVLLDPAFLVPITREQASDFLDKLQERLSTWPNITKVEREGDGRAITRATVEQDQLRAPSLDILAEAVRAIPNNNELFPDRTSYLRLGYAIRAAAGEENENEAQSIFAEWAGRWTGNERSSGNDPDVVLADWRRMRGPYAVGWNFVSDQARSVGFETASLDFDVIAPKPDEAAIADAPDYSDQWLAARIVERQRGVLRYAPQSGRYLVWDGTRWQPDAELLAEDLIKQELRRVAAAVLQQGGSEKEIKASQERAYGICSAKRARDVTQFLRSDREIAVSMNALDFDPWVLNTPAGIVDLRTGDLRPSDPDALCAKITSVPPDKSGSCPEWRRFLAEATGGDRELESYLQRLCGYCLTGSTIEQQLSFLYGNGGNGKSVFLNVISGILGDYARVATSDVFTASNSERHSTDIAMLVGARLVTASETTSGKRWDEARVKSLTGGEPVSARYMRQDNFTFLPAMKIVFVGNHRPAIRDVDAALKRRIQMVPFNVTPARVDRELGAKLREEWPAILAWCIEGCLSWGRTGLTPPASVLASTEEYFEAEDAIGRWMAEDIERVDGAVATSQELFDSWREWAGRNGEWVGSQKRLSSALVARKVQRWRDVTSRRMGFAGLRVLDRQGIDVL